MISSSKNYIEGFVETCYKYGIHEKQAAVLLNLAQVREVMADEGMQKEARFRSAWEASKLIGRSLGGLGKGVAQLGASPFKGTGSALKTIGSGTGKAIKGVGRWTQDTAKLQDKIMRTGIATGAGAAAIGGAGYGVKNLWNDFRNSDTTANHIANNILGHTVDTSGISASPGSYQAAQTSQYDGPVNEGWGDTLGSPSASPNAPVTSGNAPQVTYGEKGPLSREQASAQALRNEIARQDASFADSPAKRMERMRSAERQSQMNELARLEAEAAKSQSYTQSDIAKRLSEIAMQNAKDEAALERLRKIEGRRLMDVGTANNSGILEQKFTGLQQALGLRSTGDQAKQVENEIKALQAQIERRKEIERQLRFGNNYRR